MSALLPFEFDSTPIRIVDHEGTLWFVLRDLLTAMGTSTPVTVAVESVKQGLGEGFNDVVPLQTEGGLQQFVVVSEMAATYLVSRSNTETGRKLNRFIHLEVLPQIRKTGKYEPAHTTGPLLPAEVGEKTIGCMMRVAELFKVPPSYAMQVAAQEAARQTGMPWDRLLTQAAVMSNVPAEEVMLEPSDLGKLFDLTGAQMNQTLKDLGLQEKIAGEWVPTEEGMALCSRHAWTTRFKSGYNLKWKAAEIEKKLR